METIAVENNIAYLLKQMGQNEQAMVLLEKVIEKREVKLGPDHPYTLRSVSNLAYTYNATNRYAKGNPTQPYFNPILILF